MRYALPLFLALAGCAAKSTVIEPKPPVRKLSEFQHLRLRVAATDDDARSMYRTANHILTDDLRSRAIFKSVLQEEEGGGQLLLSVTITQASTPNQYSGGGMRMSSGKITLLCNLTEIPSGDEVGSFTVSGKSGAFGPGGEAREYEALGAALRSVGAYIQKYK